MELDTKRSLAFEDLPLEIIEYIFSFLQESELISFVKFLNDSQPITGMVYTSLRERRNARLQKIESFNRQFRSKVYIGLFTDCFNPVNVVKPEEKYMWPPHCKTQLELANCESCYEKHFPSYFLMSAMMLLLYSKRYVPLKGDVELSFESSKYRRNDLNDSFNVWFMDQVLHSTNMHETLTKLTYKLIHTAPHTKRLRELFESTIHDFSDLTHLLLENQEIYFVEKFRFPKNVTCLSLANNRIRRLPKFPDAFPPKLIYLNLSCNRIASLKGAYFPDCLESLNIHNNSIVKLSGANWPPSLKVLIASGNKLRFMKEKVQFPKQLQVLNLVLNPQIASFEGVRFPRSLKRLLVDRRHRKLPLRLPGKDCVFYTWNPDLYGHTPCPIPAEKKNRQKPVFLRRSEFTKLN